MLHIHYTHTVKDLNKQLEKEKKKSEPLREKVRSLNRDLAELELTKTSATKESRSLKKQHDAANTELTTLRQLTPKCKSLEAEVRELEVRLAKLNAKHNGALEELNETRSKLKQTAREMESTKSDLEADLSALQAEQSNSEGLASETQLKLKSASEELRAEVARFLKLSEEHSQLQNRHLEQQERIAQLTSSLDASVSATEREQSRLHDSSTKLQHALKESSVLKEKLSAADAKTRTLAEEMEALNTTRSLQDVELSHRAESVKQLKSSVDELRAANEELHKDVAKQQAEKESMDRDLTEAKSATTTQVCMRVCVSVCLCECVSVCEYNIFIQ
jgi:chromosome segregation ATPase